MNAGTDRRRENLLDWAKTRAPYVLAAMALLLVISIVAYVRYEGTMGSFVLFNVTYLALVLLAIPRPRSYVYTFLSLFLFLGFWSKFVAHVIVGYAFVEPVGNFASSGASWDRALVVASCGAIGIVLARGLYLLAGRRYVATDVSSSGKVPSWYQMLKWPVWVATLILVVALNVWNLFAGFYQIGLEPRLVLPLYLNVVASWLINFGFALWIAALVYWEILARRGLTPLVLLVPLAEGFISSTSTLSRKAYLFHLLPYALILFEKRHTLWRTLRRRMRTAVLLLFALGFLCSLVAVSAYRLYAYYPADQAVSNSPESTATEDPSPIGGSEVRKQQTINMAKQVLGLSIDRWTGLEGILAVSSHSDLGWDQMVTVIKEDPTKGESAIYQGVSDANKIYVGSDRTTFMSLPGVMAILSFSGSLIVVAAGMSLVTLALMLVELVYSSALGNPFIVSVAGLAMATTLCELNFVNLAGWFFSELFVTLFVLWVIQNLHGASRKRVLHEGA